MKIKNLELVKLMESSITNKPLKVSSPGGPRTLEFGTGLLEAAGAELLLMDPQRRLSTSVRPVSGRRCKWTWMEE